ncbi:MAG: ABC transporter permease [Chloroflexi bacterium]|nr:ABC transporter permease [Chloroflexota bacterium]
MFGYLLKRLIWLPIVLWAVSSLTFLALRIVPGNPIQTVQNQVMDKSQLAQVEAVWGLNRPIAEQYLHFLARLARGDLGLAMSSGVPIRRMIFERMPPTIELAVVSLFVSTALGVLSGVASVAIRSRAIDYSIRTASILGLSLPLFWVGIMLIILFSVKLRWTPTSGRIGAGVDYEVITNFMFYDLIATGNWEAFGSFLRHLVLPGVTIGLTSAGFVARLTRSAMLEVMNSDYVRTARAKGLYERSVIWKHAMRNAMLPIITLQGLQFGSILGGAVITERVFSYPGMGAWLLDGILERDYSVVQGGIIFVALAYVLMNLLVDTLYHVIDPRLRNAKR